MKVLLHDFPGHPFPVDLTRELGRRGHSVVHRWSPDVASGRGLLEVRDDDPISIRFSPVSIGHEFERYAAIGRLRDEVRYASELLAGLDDDPPHVVISGQAPITVQRRVASWCVNTRTPLVFWLQDVLSIGASRHLGQSFGMLGRLLGRGLQILERRSLQLSGHVIAITDGFDPLLDEWGIAASRRTVIENWAPLDGFPVGDRSNAWGRTHGLDDTFVFLYSGTLGLKHDPSVLLALARAVQGRAKVVVVSEGLGRRWLHEHSHGVEDTLVFADYQTFEQFPDVLATADVLVALLEPEAGTFSVPSKVLSYLAAGRPVLAAIPPNNLAAQVLTREECGIVVSPKQPEAFARAALNLLDDEVLRTDMGLRGRAYAERAFDIEAITDRFEEILTKVVRDG